MGAWGDVNAALNRLVAEGLITSFTTNIGDRNRAGPVVVGVTADGAGSDEAHRAVTRALARLGLTAEVTVSPEGVEPARSDL